VEGVLIDYSKDNSNCDCYVIRVDRVVWEGRELPNDAMIGREARPPINGTPTSMGNVTNYVSAAEPASLDFARLYYGSSAYPVERNETLPLPETFDFEKPEECARLIFAIMSNASGGHTLHKCTLRIDPVRRVANLTAGGVHVFYKPINAPKMTVEEAIAATERIWVLELGNVFTDQYGYGWKRARWSM
jgi:hypothetical protein